jgi:hypothetical protein
MKIGDHPAQKPSLEHLIGTENPVLSIFLRGHLVIEALINQIILLKGLKTKSALSKLNCAAKIKVIEHDNIISSEFYEYLLNMNRLRNEFAHRLGYDLTKDDVHLLIKLAGNSPEVEFTDDMHKLDQKTLYEWYGDTAGVLEEMFKHVSIDMGFILEELGGELPFTD